MVTYSNIQRHDNLPFDDYMKLDGYSHSFLKRERFGMVEELTITDNIIIGKLVDGIITEPGTVDMKNKLYPVAKLIAYEITRTFGDFIKYFDSQVSFTGDIKVGDFIMPAKVRLDFLLPKHAAIEMKVTMSKNIDAIIKHMGYENQLWHQTKMADVKKGYFLFHSVPLKKTIILTADCSSDHNEFWAEKTLLFGKFEPA
jgi:hypothetical protein